MLRHSHQHAWIGRARSAGGRTGPAQTGPRALSSPRSLDASGLPPGPTSHGCRDTPPLPCLRIAVLRSKANSGRTAQAAPLRQGRGDGRQRSETSAPIGCVPGGRAQRDSGRPIGRRGRPARAGRGRPPPPRVAHGRPWRARKAMPAARKGSAPPTHGLRRCSITPAQRDLNTGGGAGAARQRPRSGRQRGILGWREARGWESPLTPTDSARADPETAPSSRGASRGPPDRGRIGAGGKGGRGRLGSPTSLPRALR